MKFENEEKIHELEQEYGSYQMISNIFKYNKLRNDPRFTLIPFKDAVYRGCIKDGDQRDGMGIMEYDSGRIYEGYWLNDKRHGKGFEKYKNGNTYDGEFERGKANGEGIYLWRGTGEFYKG